VYSWTPQLNLAGVTDITTKLHNFFGADRAARQTSAFTMLDGAAMSPK
jgi:hypothetical protein